MRIQLKVDQGRRCRSKSPHVKSTAGAAAQPTKHCPALERPYYWWREGPPFGCPANSTIIRLNHFLEDLPGCCLDASSTVRRVPEPSSVMLIAVGMLGLVWTQRKRKRRCDCSRSRKQERGDRSSIVPGAFYSFARGISNIGQIVGESASSPGGDQGLLDIGGTFSAINVWC